MKKVVAAAVAAVALAGCQPTAAPTPNALPEHKDETDVRVRTPKASIDVRDKGDGKGVNVDVERKKADR